MAYEDNVKESIGYRLEINKRVYYLFVNWKIKK